MDHRSYKDILNIIVLLLIAGIIAFGSWKIISLKFCEIKINTSLVAENNTTIRLNPEFVLYDYERQDSDTECIITLKFKK